MNRILRLIFVNVLLVFASLSFAVEAPREEPDLPDGTQRALDQIATFRHANGFTIELFAAEPKLASPVAISLDERGRVYIAEEYRFSRGTEENRTRPFLLDDDLQLRTVEDRLKMFEKWSSKFEGGMKWFTQHGDQLRRLEDSKGSGRADRSTVFARGFNGPLDGLAAGVLARDGDVYFTCIPNLWRLRDSKDTGVADEKQALLTGFGVNCAFLGHDLHGLIFGPDGRLYFSIGDRGFHVATKEGSTLSGPRTGAIFRCEPDGSKLEVVMRGLRNPQELAFDQFGNLFADDNNCDKGDHARLVYAVEDGDCGWNMAFQSMTGPYPAGAWFAEKMWHLQHTGQPAWIVPPVGKIGTGPSGFLFTSGMTLPERYSNSFIMCNYAGGQGLEAFRVKPRGAGFEIIDYHDFLKPIMATDAEFGPDGKLYISDFVNLDWSGKSLGGRIYTLFDPVKIKDPETLVMKKLFAEGFDKLSDDKLAELLGHTDQKVRLRAQWELAKRDRAGSVIFSRVLEKKIGALARLHALWGLGQLARQNSQYVASIKGYLADSEPEIRGQAAKMIAESQLDSQAADVLADQIIPLLADPQSRVQFFAAQALGRLKSRKAIEPLFQFIANDRDSDPFLRHAGVAALNRIGDADAVASHSADSNPGVRMAVVLVQRRMKDTRITRFLGDSEPLIRAEAARAIHDLPIESLLPKLAEMLPRLSGATDEEATIRRALHAAFRLGGEEQLRLVLDAAANPNLSVLVRMEAVQSLKSWPSPAPRDRIIGVWRELPGRDPAIVRRIIDQNFEKLLGNSSDTLLTEVVSLIGALGLSVSEDVLVNWVEDIQKAVAVRVSALRVLQDRKAKRLHEVVLVALKAQSALLRAEARDIMAANEPEAAVRLFADLLADPSSSIVERQRAIAALARVKNTSAARELDLWAERLGNGNVPDEIQLDLLEALSASRTQLRDRYRSVFESKLRGGVHSSFTVSLKGGDAARGREIFFGHAAAQCVRCHIVAGQGGNAGPELTKVVSRYPEKSREFLLESLLQPSAKIASGFGSVTLTLIDGRAISGTLLKEDNKEVQLQLPNGMKRTISRDEIERKSAILSPMPSVEKTLSPREVRDLIEFLMTLRD